MTTARHGFLALFAAVLALVLTTVACTKRAQPVWRKSGTTQENRNRDEINCRGLARRTVAREYRAEESQAGSGEYRTGPTAGQIMNRLDAKKRQRRLFEDCLKSRGYGKFQPPPKTPAK